MPFPNVQCFLVERVDKSETCAEHWRHPGTDEIKPYPSAFGPGAIFRDYETEDNADAGLKFARRGNDGFAWMVNLPIANGYGFELDTRSTDDPPKFWERTGSPPDFTLRPSIRIPGRNGTPDRWHGWLTNGELVPC